MKYLFVYALALMSNLLKSLPLPVIVKKSFLRKFILRVSF